MSLIFHAKKPVTHVNMSSREEELHTSDLHGYILEREKVPSTQYTEYMLDTRLTHIRLFYLLPWISLQERENSTHLLVLFIAVDILVREGELYTFDATNPST